MQAGLYYPLKPALLPLQAGSALLPLKAAHPSAQLEGEGLRLVEDAAVHLSRRVRAYDGDGGPSPIQRGSGQSTCSVHPMCMRCACRVDAVCMRCARSVSAVCCSVCGVYAVCAVCGGPA